MCEGNEERKCEGSSDLTSQQQPTAAAPTGESIQHGGANSDMDYSLLDKGHQSNNQSKISYKTLGAKFRVSECYIDKIIYYLLGYTCR
jgi:hypothetical protein